jgi:hypothetical protein
MKISIAILALATSASAFAPASFGVRSATKSASVISAANGGGDDEEGGLDLNLEEMFDM